MKSRILHLKTAGTIFGLFLILFGSGCVQQSQVKQEAKTVQKPKPMVFNLTENPNPMFNTGLVGKKGAAKEMADWVILSKDNKNKPFAIIDKVEAKLYVFDKYGRQQGDAPVLLGLAKGDISPPGIGEKPLSQIKPDQRITPAGRFVARMGKNHKGKDTLWVDYDESLSMHAVIKGVPRDRRAQRLASETPLDNRISFGCINVPKPFFKDIILEEFSETASVIYIMPETREFGRLFSGENVAGSKNPG
jgi:hypothetical protein